MSDRPTPEQMDNLIRWARRCYYETSDLGLCPYYLGTGSCGFGCRDEPECHTCIWTIDTLDDPDENGDVPQVKAWLSDLLDPYWQERIFGASHE